MTNCWFDKFGKESLHGLCLLFLSLQTKTDRRKKTKITQTCFLVNVGYDCYFIICKEERQKDKKKKKKKGGNFLIDDKKKKKISMSDEEQQSNSPHLLTRDYSGELNEISNLDAVKIIPAERKKIYQNFGLDSVQSFIKISTFARE
jgi:hypothetical protein